MGNDLVPLLLEVRRGRLPCTALRPGTPEAALHSASPVPSEAALPCSIICRVAQVASFEAQPTQAQGHFKRPSLQPSYELLPSSSSSPAAPRSAARQAGGGAAAAGPGPGAHLARRPAVQAGVQLQQQQQQLFSLLVSGPHTTSQVRFITTCSSVILTLLQPHLTAAAGLPASDSVHR